MKKFVRFILIGVCIFSGYSLVEASDQVDTIYKCFEEGISIPINVIDSAFHAFLMKDSVGVCEHINQDGRKIKYERLGNPSFSGEGVVLSKESIGKVTTGLRNQYINCTITYTRKITFKNTDTEDDFWGERENGYPNFELDSKREWHAVICIRKSNKRTWQVQIIGDTCVDNAKTFSIPDTFQDMTIEWFCRGKKIPNAKSCQMSFSKNDIPVNALTALVRCDIKMCTNELLAKDSIRIRLDKTPASTLAFSDCVPAVSRLANPTLQITASNKVPGVTFQWDKEGLEPIRPLSATSQKVNYPIQGSDNFTIVLTTLGGCNSSKTSKVVHRKLSDGVGLQVSDSCPTAGTPFYISTVPPLPNMILQWETSGLQQLVPPTTGDRRRTDQIMVNSTAKVQFFSTITVTDYNCKGSTTKSIQVSEPYTEMTAKDDNGNTVKKGDTIAAGAKEITFFAPKHSTIIEEDSYNWEVWILRGVGSMSSMIPSTGSAERTISVPASARISVRVWYTSSCRGRDSKEYEVYSR